MRPEEKKKKLLESRKKEQSKDMPKFSMVGQVITITGRAIPEFADMAWRPLLDDIESFVKDKRNIIINFDMDYFNSSSSRYVTNLFNRLEKLYPRTITEINWFYDEDDEATEAHAEIYKESHTKLKFKILAR